jgi:hypothetical protein
MNESPFQTNGVDWYFFLQKNHFTLVIGYVQVWTYWGIGSSPSFLDRAQTFIVWYLPHPYLPCDIFTTPFKEDIGSRVC